ncbi:MAG: excinuclease ABC subunit UvrA [bacterium]|nr:excinuclease ABC subunit UvrA [bacterium]
MHKITIKNARTNNLKGVSLEIPHHQLIAVTGVSGSGKSSLAFDVIAREGQRRYFETMPGFARQFLGKLNKPEVDSIDGLSPVIAIGQKTTASNARSTVGTLSDLYDLLRLLYARFGESEEQLQLSRSLFSFNSEIGQCPQCRGIGQEEKIDIDKLVVDPSKTLREGALAPTLPTGYIMYSQVTIDVLNQVCEAEGFNVDIPWEELTEEQQNVILYGSDKIKVPFGKHSIESRLKWTGIKAKPREEGYYKGMMPIMSDILRRDRNANILKYVSSVTCSDCHGKRLNPQARSVQLNRMSITDVAELEFTGVKDWIADASFPENANTILLKLQEKLHLLIDLGLGYLTMDTAADSLSASEAQRIRVINQLTAPLSDVLYVLDEPSIGLHPTENRKMIAHLHVLVNRGNTVLVVEHDLETIRSADWIIDIGPKAGLYGGELLFNGPIQKFLESNLDNSLTLQALKNSATSTQAAAKTTEKKLPSNSFVLNNCHTGNLKNIDVRFLLGGLNSISGKSGSGTRPLVQELRNRLESRKESDGSVAFSHEDEIKNIIFVDQSPIGRTPRSNPATYLGISDDIRDLYASLDTAKKAKFTKSRFSFNNKGGRCETCQGAGKIQVGMHFLGNIDLKCGTCGGDRFNKETLAIHYQGKSIADVYRMSVNEALDFFQDTTNKTVKRLRKGVEILQEIGLGYLTLGQSSTTLSGGEAQRIKIANQLQKKSSGKGLFLLMEPSIGLHHSDIQTLLKMFERIKSNGNTIVCVEQDERIISESDWHIELGPEGGKQGGEIIYQGNPRTSHLEELPLSENRKIESVTNQRIELQGVHTNGLKNVDVSIPKQQLTVVTGVSGSGKSSLVYDTLFSEASARFSESLSTYSRSLVQQNSVARLDNFSGMTPAVALRRRNRQNNKRSTVGTLTGIYDHFRLLIARVADEDYSTISAQHFSFNHHLGACPMCKGMGVVEACDPNLVVIEPSKNIWEGALSENKSLKYYSNPDGQFMATLQTIAQQRNWDIFKPWRALSEEIQQVILYGTGDEQWKVTWNFKNKSRSGVQELEMKWLGLCGYINDEFERKRQNKNIQSLEALLHDVTCPTCAGSRLKSELLSIQFLDKNIAEWMRLTVSEMRELLEDIPKIKDAKTKVVAKKVSPSILTQLAVLENLGLSYLNMDRGVATLSGGEYQRVLLSGQLDSNLNGVTYILDEPTIGLDQQQVKTLEKLLRGIIKHGNTVVVVEHDPQFIQFADYIIEMGPEAGENGGQVIFQGDQNALLKNRNTKTYSLLHENVSLRKIQGQSSESFTVHKASANNLKNIDVRFQLGAFTVISGVSGSGKTSLMRDVLYQSTLRKRPVHCASITGANLFEEFQTVYIDQQPLATTRAMTPAGFLGILDALQAIYSKVDEAKSTGLKKSDFSYLSKKGKCPTCAGNGRVKTSLDFMSDVWTDCDTCFGSRYSEDINAILWRERSIGELLQLTIDQSMEFLADQKISGTLQLLIKLGLGHIRLGQPANTLSGGESQRVKLAKALVTSSHLPRLFLLDEPGTGLHVHDLQRLLAVFQEIIDGGDTIISIDHNQQLIASASHEIKLGPGSGQNGGRLQ